MTATTTASRQRLGRLQWTALGIAFVTVLAGVGVATALVRHYRDAPRLRCACGLIWAGPDAAAAPASSDATMTVTARAGTRQAFLVQVINTSSVTQTILGLAAGEPTSYQTALDAATVRPNQNFAGLRYSSPPLAVAPGGQAALRLSFRAVCVGANGRLF